jgi:PhoPQ-activated pathogenicity-related protein
VDPRVVAIMPVVIDALNSEVITKHHFEAYGFFSSSLNDYVRHGLFPHKIGTADYRAVLKIEDPYEYRNRPSMKMPKYLDQRVGRSVFPPGQFAVLLWRSAGGKSVCATVPNAKQTWEGRTR